MLCYHYSPIIIKINQKLAWQHSIFSSYLILNTTTVSRTPVCFHVPTWCTCLGVQISTY